MAILDSWKQAFDILSTDLRIAYFVPEHLLDIFFNLYKSKLLIHRRQVERLIEIN